MLASEILKVTAGVLSVVHPVSLSTNWAVLNDTGVSVVSFYMVT